MIVAVVTAAELEQDAQRKLRWGDYHMGRALERALVAQGHVIDAAQHPEVLIHCYGLPAQSLPDYTYNILWIHSHPDTLTKEYVAQYDKVFCLSPMYLGKLYEWGVDAELLVGATEFEPMQVPLEHDVVFVANAKAYKGNSRAIIDALGDLSQLPFKLEIWGEGWKTGRFGRLPDGIWQEEYYANDQLSALYASSAVVLNDEHDDMQREGFINPRVLDAIAAGSCVVTNPNPAYKLLGLPVIEFESINQIAGVVAARKAGTMVPYAMNPYPFSEMAYRLMKDIPQRKCVDLGCGNHKRPGFIGVDKVQLPGVDVVIDITEDLAQWPYELLDLGSVDYMVADNLMEHIGKQFIPLMNTLWNVVKPTGKFKIIVPSVTTTAAFSDPTHVRFFAPDSWDYFDAAHERWRDYGQSYGIKPWRILHKALRDRFIEVVMQPVRER